MASVLDTNIVIYALNGDPTTVIFLEKFADEPFVISIITWIEAIVGAEKHLSSSAAVSAYLQHLAEIAPLDGDIAQSAATIIIGKRRKGKKVKEYHDEIIAATAIERGARLITNNPKDFRGIKGLEVIPLQT